MKPTLARLIALLLAPQAKLRAEDAAKIAAVLAPAVKNSGSRDDLGHPAILALCQCATDIHRFRQIIDCLDRCRSWSQGFQLSNPVRLLR